MRINDYTDPRNLPYTVDVVVWREGDYAVAKIRGKRGEESEKDLVKLFYDSILPYIGRSDLRVVFCGGLDLKDKLVFDSFSNLFVYADLVHNNFSDLYEDKYPLIVLKNCNNVKVVLNVRKLDQFIQPNYGAVGVFVDNCNNVEIIPNVDVLIENYCAVWVRHKPYDSFYNEDIRVHDGFIRVRDSNGEVISGALISVDNGCNIKVYNNECYIEDTLMYGSYISNVEIYNNKVYAPVLLLDFPLHEFPYALHDIVVKDNVIYCLGIEKANPSPFIGQGFKLWQAGENPPNVYDVYVMNNIIYTSTKWIPETVFYITTNSNVYRCKIVNNFIVVPKAPDTTDLKVIRIETGTGNILDVELDNTIHVIEKSANYHAYSVVLWVSENGSIILRRFNIREINTDGYVTYGNVKTPTKQGTTSITGDGSTTVFTIVDNLDDMFVSTKLVGEVTISGLKLGSDYYVEIADVDNDGKLELAVVFPTAPASGTTYNVYYRLQVVGF